VLLDICSSCGFVKEGIASSFEDFYCSLLDPCIEFSVSVRGGDRLLSENEKEHRDVIYLRWRRTCIDPRWRLPLQTREKLREVYRKELRV